MKRAFSFEYSSDEEEDAWLARVLDDFERQLQTDDNDGLVSSDDDAYEDWVFTSDEEADQLLANAVDEAEQRGAQVNQSKVALEWLCFEDHKLGNKI